MVTLRHSKNQTTIYKCEILKCSFFLIKIFTATFMNTELTIYSNYEYLIRNYVHTRIKK